MKLGRASIWKNFSDVDHGAASHLVPVVCMRLAGDIYLLRAWKSQGLEGANAKLIQKLTIVIVLCCIRDTLTLGNCILLNYYGRS